MPLHRRATLFVAEPQRWRPELLEIGPSWWCLDHGSLVRRTAECSLPHLRIEVTSSGTWALPAGLRVGAAGRTFSDAVKLHDRLLLVVAAAEGGAASWVCYSTETASWVEAPEPGAICALCRKAIEHRAVRCGTCGAAYHDELGQSCLVALGACATCRSPHDRARVRWWPRLA